MRCGETWNFFKNSGKLKFLFFPHIEVLTSKIGKFCHINVDEQAFANYIERTLKCDISWERERDKRQ